MPTLSEMMPSKYIKFSDCEDCDLIVTIRGVESERLGQGKDADDKWVLYFSDHDKGLVLNKTNTKAIGKLHGDNSDDWEGKKIALYATEVTFGNETMMGVRVRVKAPIGKKPKPEGAAVAIGLAAPLATPEPGEDEDIPF